MQKLTLTPIGKVQRGADTETVKIIINEPYRRGLLQLSDFRHIYVLWWFHNADTASHHRSLEAFSPYKNAPETLGVFATRSPNRPNPIALSCCEITSVDRRNGVIETGYIDAEHDSPVLDIKPYMPSLDRIESPQMPEWCKHWPMSVEASDGFDWDRVFNF